MPIRRNPWPALAGFLAGLLMASLMQASGGAPAASNTTTPEQPPRFTEEREAAALFFVKKHVPDLLPLLEQLKKSRPAQYEREIREIFQVTDWLADLRDDPPRYDLELKIWIAESKANVLIARLSAAPEAQRKGLQAQLREQARRLAGLDIHVLEVKAEELEKELSEVKDELGRAKDSTESRVQERYGGLLERARKTDQVP